MLEFSVISIAVMLAVPPTTVTLAACLRGIALSIGIIVKAYPIANASPTPSTSVEIISQPSIKPIAAPIPSPMLQPIKHLRTCFAVCHRKLLLPYVHALHPYLYDLFSLYTSSMVHSV
jgi:hypothetical protein